MRGFHVYGRTDVGRVREVNEDHILVGRIVKNRESLGMYFGHADDYLASHGLLFAVADGVGGCAGGALASRLTLSAFDTQFYGTEKGGETIDGYVEALTLAGNRANRDLLSLAAAKPDLAHMGSTIAGVCLMARGYLVFHAGDSRVYRLRNGYGKQLTVDDSLRALAVSSGFLSAREAEESEPSHTITNCVGSNDFALHIAPGPDPRDGDVLLICSDGLHDMLDLDFLESAVAASRNVVELVDALVDGANAAGGHDNISVVAIGSDLFDGNFGRCTASAREIKSLAPTELVASGGGEPVAAPAVASEAMLIEGSETFAREGVDGNQ